MNPTIISSLISAAVAILVCVINSRADAEKMRALMDYRLSQLEKKVDKHNNLIERTYRLEEQAAVHEEKIKVVNHRLTAVEERNGA